MLLAGTVGLMREPHTTWRRAHGTIGPPYQSHMKAMDSPIWWIATAAAPEGTGYQARDLTPQREPSGAPLRSAQMSAANGMSAKIGMQMVPTCKPRAKFVNARLPPALGRLPAVRRFDSGDAPARTRCAAAAASAR